MKGPTAIHATEGIKLLKTSKGDREEKDIQGLWLCTTQARVSTRDSWVQPLFAIIHSPYEV